jgi:hypothetical protein
MLVEVKGTDGKVIGYNIQNLKVQFKIKLLKVDETEKKTPLKGAEFALYRAKDMESVTLSAEGVTPVVTTLKPKDGATPVKTVTTDDKGEASLGWLGLNTKDSETETGVNVNEGEYYLVETKAPTNYLKLRDPVRIFFTKAGWSYQQVGKDKVEKATDGVVSFTVKVTNKAFGDLKIIKYLPTYEVSEEATFVFDVVGKDDDGNVVYTNVAVLTLKKEGSRSTVLHHIPDGAHITVTERYTGSHYELDSAANQTTTIVANRTVSVNFTNKYNYDDNGGHGLANIFNPNTNGGWTHDGVTTNTSTPNDQTLEDYTPESGSPAQSQAEPVAEEG